MAAVFSAKGMTIEKGKSMDAKIMDLMSDVTVNFQEEERYNSGLGKTGIQDAATYTGRYVSSGSRKQI